MQDLEDEVDGLEEEQAGWPAKPRAERSQGQAGPSSESARRDSTAESNALGDLLARVDELELLLQRMNSRVFASSAPELVEVGCAGVPSATRAPGCNRSPPPPLPTPPRLDLAQYRLQAEAARLQLSPSAARRTRVRSSSRPSHDSVVEHARVRRQELRAGQEKVESLVRRSQNDARSSDWDPLTRSPFFSFDEDSSVSAPSGSPHSSASSSPAWSGKAHGVTDGASGTRGSRGGGHEGHTAPRDGDDLDEEERLRQQFEDAST